MSSSSLYALAALTIVGSLVALEPKVQLNMHSRFQTPLSVATPAGVIPVRCSAAASLRAPLPAPRAPGSRTPAPGLTALHRQGEYCCGGKGQPDCKDQDVSALSILIRNGPPNYTDPGALSIKVTVDGQSFTCPSELTKWVPPKLELPALTKPGDCLGGILSKAGATQVDVTFDSKHNSLLVNVDGNDITVPHCTLAHETATPLRGLK